MTLLEEFKAFIASMPLVQEERKIYQNNKPMFDKDKDATYTSSNRILKPYHFNPDPGFDDFDKNNLLPNVYPEYPEGCVSIRSDCSFWVEAILPYKFAQLTLQEIVAVLWWYIPNPKYGPDIDVTEVTLTDKISTLIEYEKM